MIPISAAGSISPALAALQQLNATGPAAGGVIPPDALKDIAPTIDAGQTGIGAARSQPSFASLFKHFVNEVNDKQTAAADNVHALESGGNVSLHQTMISMEEASVSFQLMVEVRNKLLDSYQELMRMQV